jgi:diaminohydroxyphosphoribosylaminopyrimidine deaminase / 5-amino-6-(5-phosphoribosylamino)uracil reductase
VDDTGHMRRALDLAERGWGTASPNPLVGVVVVRPELGDVRSHGADSVVGDGLVAGDGQVVGEGWYSGPGAGYPHAEARALQAAGELARGATVYTSLEPCDHFGRTPPCTRALIDAGVARVVVAATDPNPIVNGRGLARLREVGIDVQLGPFGEEARRLNEAFERFVTTGRPFVAAKMAATLDGKVAARDGSSRWISGEASRADGHRMRAWADAIVVGAGTALADDPSLTVRAVPYAGAPVLRVLVDASGRVPATMRLFDGEAPTLVATTERSPAARRAAWVAAGAEVATLDASDRGVALPALVELLGKRDLQSVLLEGGPTLAWSAVAEGVVDKLVLYVAPMLVGGADAPGILGGDGVAPIGAARRVDIHRVDRIGDDIKVEAYVHRDR